MVLFSKAVEHASRIAIVDPDQRYTYQELLDQSAHAAVVLLDGRTDLEEERVAFMIPPSMAHGTTQWGIWRAGGMAVPLCLQYPGPELEYTIDDSGASVVVAHPDFSATLRPITEERGLRFLLTGDLLGGGQSAVDAGVALDADRRGMLIYTSGTTSKPKGTVYHHGMITAQIESLVEAWGWSKEDHILHVLPLHHVHGIINVLSCALWSGARCEFLPAFDPVEVWKRLMAEDGPNVFMAVPTIYSRLIKAWEDANEEVRKTMREGCERMRLMVSGSAALPVPVLEKWREISGHTLLERYGMTEIGMALSNPLEGERKPGCVGTPLPGVELRLVNDDHHDVEDAVPGTIQVKGPGVFREYWDKPGATAEAFTGDGWFKTGDVAVRENGVYRIMGRESVDIIKTGGYKVSALEIEEVLRGHDSIDECAVVGIDDEEWGQRVAAVAVLHPDRELEIKPLREWCKKRLAPYKVPTLLKNVKELPRNAMGKVIKPNVVRLFK